MKICSKCGVEKHESEYGRDCYAKDGLAYSCKECRRAKDKLRDKEKLRIKNAKWRAANKSYHNEYQMRYKYGNWEGFDRKLKKTSISYEEAYKKKMERLAQYKKEHPEAIKRNQKRYAEKPESKKKVLEYNRARYKNDSVFKTKSVLRARVGAAIKNCAAKKAFKTLFLIGCTIDELRVHLQTQWLEGMSWDNWEMEGWHIDHIYPCDQYDLTQPEEQRKCFNYRNLQPLWSSDNFSKNRWLEHPTTQKFILEHPELLPAASV